MSTAASSRSRDRGANISEKLSTTKAPLLSVSDRYDVALAAPMHRRASSLLLKHVRDGHKQEDLCFALWRPSTGAERTTALIFDLIAPLCGERHLHGGASFEAAYLVRAIRVARDNNAGLAFMHSHLSPGWQSMSSIDVVAERDRIAPPAKSCGLPLVGLTLGTDESWSARFWLWDGKQFQRRWCDKVRVVGTSLKITYNDERMPPPGRSPMLSRTTDTWGPVHQADIARLRVGVVGVGSVGSMVAEALARIGVQHLVLIDGDRVDVSNLDRLIHARRHDVGKFKANLVAKRLKCNATGWGFSTTVRTGRIQEASNYLAAIDCDVLFAAVDRPLPKDLLNHIAYVHHIPVIFGGVFVAKKSDGELGQAAWSVVIAGPENRCLRCDGQYTSSEVVQELDGSLSDPGYVNQLGKETSRAINANVFPFCANVASHMVLQGVRLIAQGAWWPTINRMHYSYIPGRLTTNLSKCRATCSIVSRTAHGDAFRYPFLERRPEPPKELFKRLYDLLRYGRRKQADA